MSASISFDAINHSRLMLWMNGMKGLFQIVIID